MNNLRNVYVNSAKVLAFKYKILKPSFYAFIEVWIRQEYPKQDYEIAKFVKTVKRNDFYHRYSHFCL